MSKKPSSLLHSEISYAHAINNENFDNIWHTIRRIEEGKKQNQGKQLVLLFHILPEFGTAEADVQRCKPLNVYVQLPVDNEWQASQERWNNETYRENGNASKISICHPHVDNDVSHSMIGQIGLGDR